MATLTVYADSGGDGMIQQNATNVAWATIRATGQSCGTGGDCDVIAAASSDHIVRVRAGSSTWGGLARGFYPFDTSALSETVFSATLSIYGTTKIDSIGSADWTINIYSNAQASNTALQKSDFDQTGTTDFSSLITYTNWSTSAYNDFILNANGTAVITGGGWSKFSAKDDDHDVGNSQPAGAGSNNACQLEGYFSNQTGTTNDPKLVITYEAVAVAVSEVYRPQVTIM